MTDTARNGLDAQALNATQQAVADDNEAGNVTFRVEARWDGGFRVSSTTGDLRAGGAVDGSRSAGKFTMATDEPTSLLGTDKSASPGEYLLQALAGCYGATLSAIATEKELDLDGVSMDLEADFNLGGFLGLNDTGRSVGASTVRVDLKLDVPGADDAEVKDLVTALESRSPIRNTLVSPVEVVTSLV